MGEAVATVAELAQLRDMIDEPDMEGGWTDERLNLFIENARNTNGSTNLRVAAARIWEVKAAEVSQLTDVTESASSRRNSQVFDHALQMAANFSATSTDPASAALAARPRSTRIVRPTRG